VATLPAAERIREKIAPLVTAANEAMPIAWMLRGWDRTVVIAVDGHPAVIVTSGGQARVAETTGRADLRFSLTEKTLDLLIAGRLSPLTAKLTGRLDSAGSLPDILRFASIFTACLDRRRAAYSGTSTNATVSRVRPVWN
jgi:hypothetical protein